jgi:hypothetical protein
MTDIDIQLRERQWSVGAESSTCVRNATFGTQYRQKAVLIVDSQSAS